MFHSMAPSVKETNLFVRCSMFVGVVGLMFVLLVIVGSFSAVVVLLLGRLVWVCASCRLAGGTGRSAQLAMPARLAVGERPKMGHTIKMRV